MPKPNEVLIEYDKLGEILHSTKIRAKEHYKSEYVNKILDTVFEEIDQLLIIHEEAYKLKNSKY
jgi:hypothetical protein